MMTRFFWAGVLAAMGAGAEPQHFVLHAPHNVWDVAVHDFNENGTQDVLVLSCDEQRYPLPKQLGLHESSRSGKYKQKPSHTIDMDPDSGIVFLAEVDGTPPKEVVVANAEGAIVYAYTPDGFDEVARPRFVSLLPSGTREPTIVNQFAQDLDGDGIDEWLVPVPLGVQIRHAEAVITRIPCDIHSEAGGGNALRISHRVPAPHTFRFAGVPQKGIAFLSDEFADFAYGPEWDQHRRFRIPVNLEEKWEASAKMADINGDNWPDLLVTQTRGTVNLEVLTQVYVAAAPFAYPEKPSATFTAQGSIANGMLRDVNGDGLLDMIYIQVPFGLGNIVNFVVRGKVRVDADVYLYDGLQFPETPNYTASLTIEAPEGREQVAHAMADFTGDGRLDLAIATDRDTLTFHLGKEDRFLDRKSAFDVSLPSFGNARTVKLDNNDKSDLLIFRPDGKHSTRVEVLVF
ncbi:MAG: FG-GAP repeat domain-containing protein [Candidatus Hydrogenedentota bacterium]